VPTPAENPKSVAVVGVLSSTVPVRAVLLERRGAPLEVWSIVVPVRAVSTISFSSANVTAFEFATFPDPLTVPAVRPSFAAVAPVSNPTTTFFAPLPFWRDVSRTSVVEVDAYVKPAYWLIRAITAAWVVSVERNVTVKAGAESYWSVTVSPPTIA
jgi:hypothetical protein